MSCDHCTAAVTNELRRVPGVDGVEADLAAKLVFVTGNGLDDAVLRAAITEAGYETAR